jgi:omega-amidase
MEKLRVGLVQMDIAWEDPQANREAIQQLLAGQAGRFDLLVLPEMFTTGFTMNAQAVAEEPEGYTEQWMSAVADGLNAVVVGSLVVKDGEAYHNRLVVATHAGTALTYDKRHLFRMAGEHEIYTPGGIMNVFNLRGWRVLPLICYDLRFPVWSRNRLQEDGSLYFDVLLYVANWPERRAHHWKSLLVGRAIENQAYVIGVNRVGIDGNGITYTGDSVVLDPLGMTLVASSGQVNLLTATLDYEALKSYREKFPAWADADNFDIYG